MFQAFNRKVAFFELDTAITSDLAKIFSPKVTQIQLFGTEI